MKIAGLGPHTVIQAADEAPSSYEVKDYSELPETQPASETPDQSPGQDEAQKQNRFGKVYEFIEKAKERRSKSGPRKDKVRGKAIAAYSACRDLSHQENRGTLFTSKT